MAQLIVRNVELAVARKLREHAARLGVSAEEAHRRILSQALLGTGCRRRKDFKAFLMSMPNLGSDKDFDRIRGQMREADLSD
jgi:plasmid stability protein